MRAIDLFAGAGGFSEGARMAGLKVVWAANHWPIAVEFHAANHEDTQHICQDLHQADWTKVPAHDIILASPACQGHSYARGKDLPHHDASRSTAWAVVSAAEIHRSKYVLVENVKGFLKWPLFPAWKLAMESLGYTTEIHHVNAADFGVPQNRERLFILCSRGKVKAFKLPSGELKTARESIQWGSGNWTKIADQEYSPATLFKISEAKRKYGERCIVGYYGQDRGRSVDEPFGTITTRDRFRIIDGDRSRMLSIPEAVIAMGFPEDYKLPSQRRVAMHLLGNAVCPPVAKGLLEQLAS